MLNSAHFPLPFPLFEPCLFHNFCEKIDGLHRTILLLAVRLPGDAYQELVSNKPFMNEWAGREPARKT